jgi:23S rRNA (cytosine1962-C5)-methyltransferase
VPLIGDVTYGGSNFPQFFLHSHSLTTDDGEVSHTTTWPLVYEHLDLLKRPQLCQWLMSWDRRRRLYPELFEGEQCLRLIHNEGTPLRADKLGATVHAGWWDDRGPSGEDLADVSRFFELIGIKQWSLQHYKKQKTQASNVLISSAPDSWQADENGAHFEFKHDVGASPGLFLDQRLQRHWVGQNSRGLKVLNLFAYTGGFSVMAALGGAETVVTVDLSKKYLEWAKDNFRLNNLPPEKYKFYDMDSQEYLKYAAKKELFFDLIICDPPSFSRNKNQTFQVDRDFKALIQKMKTILSPTGTIQFSTNFEQWDQLTWERALEPLCRTEGLEFTPILNWQWDFEIDPTASLMKAFQLKKERMD